MRAIIGAMLAMICAALLLSGHAKSAPAKMNKDKTMQAMTLWQAIEAASQQAPFSKAKIETLFSTTLTDTDNANRYWLFYQSAPVVLGDGVVLQKIDLRIKRNEPNPGFMVLDLEGACIKLDAVRKHYRDLQITDHPNGTPFSVTSYSAWLSWGRLSFSFREMEPDCLASVAFAPGEHQ